MFSLIFPKICLLCQEFCLQPYDLCTHCEQELPIISEQYYPTIPLSRKTVILFHYDFPIDYMITQLKFQQQLIYANLFGKLLSRKITLSYQNEPLPELILPVPLHPKRLCERGFNQALEIAKPIARDLKIKLSTKDCIRHINTKPQSSLRARERKYNLKNAFKLAKNLNVDHVAIVDDVITTGETIGELAHVLQQSGIKKIDIWCCARTTPY